MSLDARIEAKIEEILSDQFVSTDHFVGRSFGAEMMAEWLTEKVTPCCGGDFGKTEDMKVAGSLVAVYRCLCGAILVKDHCVTRAEHLSRTEEK